MSINSWRVVINSEQWQVKMTVESNLRFLGDRDLNQNMKKRPVASTDSGEIKMDKAILNDPNNNETILGDDQRITEKELDEYMEHYDKWKQSALGHRLTAILRDVFGYTFDAEIKWNNVFMIGIFHVIAIAAFCKYVFNATIVTYLWDQQPTRHNCTAVKQPSPLNSIVKVGLFKNGNTIKTLRIYKAIVHSFCMAYKLNSLKIPNSPNLFKIHPNHCTLLTRLNFFHNLQETFQG